MHWFRRPHRNSKALTHFDDPEPTVVAKNSGSPVKDGDNLANPTVAEYASEAAKEFLDALEAVADQIPVPGVAMAVKVAKGIMQACEESHATLERAEDLKSRIKKLMIILVDELKGKKREEVQAKLKEDIELLSKDLAYIQKKLNKIGSQNALALIFFKGLNEEKVKKCVSRLDNSLENFNLARRINDTNLLNALQNQIIAFHTSHQKSLDEMNGKMDRLQADVKAILKNKNDSPTTLHPRGRASVPANGDNFHGRESLVAQLVHALTPNSDGQKRPRVCLLGPGGMGKTSTALAVMADSDMRKHFPEKNQIWVPCVKATSVSFFLDTLYSSTGTTQDTGNTLKDIISELQSSSEPLVVLLDNFETPWNLLDSRGEIQRILNQISEIPQVAVFITMRSSFPPGSNKQWQSFDIEAVDEIAAHKIYLDICSAGGDDHDVSVLLHALGYMPLAITLMANIARMTGLGAAKLLEEYRRIGTAMLQEGPDAEQNLDICISLSVDSQPMKSHPKAYDLLAKLAMLPVGTTYDVLTKWWAHDFPNLMGPLKALTDTALIKRQDTHYFVLPVIRSYILDPSRFLPNVRTTMVASACNFLSHHNSSPGDSSFVDHAKALSAEEGNLQEILLAVEDSEPLVIEALLVLARHHLSTRPRLEAVDHALRLTHKLESHQILIGDVLTCYGRILFKLDCYDDAQKKFTCARQMFLSIPDERRAAMSSLDLAEVYTFMHDVALSEQLDLVMDAKSVFEKLDDKQAVALSLYRQGALLGQAYQHKEAIELLIHSRKMFEDPADAVNHAKCSYTLGMVYYWAKRYDKGFIAGTEAVREFEHLGQYSGESMQLLGQILFMKGDYTQALEMAVQALAICKLYGRPLDIGLTLETIGRSWAKMDRIADAKEAYADAMKYFQRMSDSGESVMRCLFLTRQADNPLLIPTEEEREMLASMHTDFDPI
ncbi:hypothetical protein GALMADRAFT_408058 [Galerina marginata CBS 339.88]|uniref:Novel STAND NTPase 1 domain-containing protein n=1 Tax=Galerina marginata (strain CBS 339.88) TaxID=685588 RepID=A0A067TF26_GALM3|nr:hypothetical protein GALMADRAFT_408058 [Galerina marginata CBS 339.88]